MTPICSDVNDVELVLDRAAIVTALGDGVPDGRMALPTSTLTLTTAATTGLCATAEAERPPETVDSEPPALSLRPEMTVVTLPCSAPTTARRAPPCNTGDSSLQRSVMDSWLRVTRTPWARAVDMIWLASGAGSKAAMAVAQSGAVSVTVTTSVTEYTTTPSVGMDVWVMLGEALVEPDSVAEVVALRERVGVTDDVTVDDAVTDDVTVGDAVVDRVRETETLADTLSEGVNDGVTDGDADTVGDGDGDDK